MTKNVRISVVLALMLSGLIAGVSVAQTDLSKFPLTKAIPADVFIAVAAKHNPERQFLSDYWAEVHKAFVASGIMEDVWELITDKVSDEQLDKIEDLRERFSTLFAKVGWSELFGKEMIYAGRFSSTFTGVSPYEGLLIGRLDSSKRAADNCANLKAILEEVVNLVEAEGGEKAVSLGEVEIEGVKFTTFGPQIMPQIVCLGSRDDLIILSFLNRTLLQESLGLLKGSSKTPGLIESEKFKTLFKQLPPAEDKLVFWDTASMFDKISGMIRSAAQGGEGNKALTAPDDERPKAKKEKKEPKKSVRPSKADDADEDPDEAKPGPAKGNNGEEQVLKMITKLLKDLAFMDCMATVEWTDGYQVFTETITTLTPDAKSTPMYGIFTGGGPIEKFERFIPEETETFWRSSGISFLKMYRYIVGFVAQVGPEGEKAVAEFEKVVNDELQLDLQKDILALFDGNMMTAKIGEDWIVMIKVTEEKKASELINRLLDVVNKKFSGPGGPGGAGGQQNALMVSDVEVNGQKNFKQISHPMMMMMGGFRPPVIGVAEGHLILASSAGTVTKCLQTAAGKHANITKNARWKKEALIPKAGAVDSISFTDESNTAAELQAVIGGISMATGMMGMFVGQEMPPEVRSFMSNATRILSKLAPVAGKIDFYQSSAAYCTFDGKAWHERKVQTYKEPKPKSESSSATEESGTDQVKAKKDTSEKKDAADKKEDRKAKRTRREKTKESATE